MRRLSKSHQSQARRSTIGSSISKVSELLNQINAKSRQGRSFDESRSSMRWDLMNVIVEFELDENGSYRAKQNLVARNISPGGAALLHSSYFYPGTTCQITIPMRKGFGKDIIVTGVIKRCTHLQGIVHELGIEFDEPIDTARVVPRRVLTQGRSEYSNPALLRGDILLVSDRPEDESLLTEALEGTSVSVACERSPSDAERGLKTKYSLILLAFSADDPSSIEFLSHMCKSGNETPVVALTQLSASQLLEQLGDHEVSGILPKPIDRSTLLTCISDYLQDGSAAKQSAA